MRNKTKINKKQRQKCPSEPIFLLKTRYQWKAQFSGGMLVRRGSRQWKGTSYTFLQGGTAVLCCSL
jgi:hypothetical protein